MNIVDFDYFLSELKKGEVMDECLKRYSILLHTEHERSPRPCHYKSSEMTSPK